MDIELEKQYDCIALAVRAEDVFGDVRNGGKQSEQEGLDKRFAELSALVSPDKYSSPEDKEIAHEAEERLKKFYQSAKERVLTGFYGAAAQLPRLMKVGHHAFETGTRKYYLGGTQAEGTVSTVCEGECALAEDFAGKCAVKIIDDPKDNDLAWKEMKTLQYLHSKGGAQRKHLPIVLDHFKTKDERVGIIFRNLDDCFDLHAVRKKYPAGVDRKHMVWMLRRGLSMLGYAHNAGVVHGNVEPAHYFIRPRDHNLFLIDWVWSVMKPIQTGEQFSIKTESYSAPEVAKKGKPTPAADLYSLGKCMIYAVGGDIETNEMPDSVEEPLQRLVRHLVLESPLQRAQDAWETHHILISTIEKLWGPRKFLHLPI